MSKHDSTRRSFLKHAAVGAGAVAGSGLVPNAHTQTPEQHKEDAAGPLHPTSIQHGAFFNYEQATTIAAFTERLMPGAPGKPWTALLMLQVPADGALPLAELRQAVADLPGVRVVQVQPELNQIYGSYLRQARWQAALGALAVIALLAWHLRSARRLAAVLLPLAASVLLVLAGLALSGAALGVLHLIGLLLVAAIGSNYALFFDHLRLRGHPDPDTLASLMLANLTTVVSFALLATAKVPALAAVGLTVAPGALLSLLLAAAFTRTPGRGGTDAVPQ